MTDDDRLARIRHNVRNHLAAVRNAAFYLQRKSERSDLWTDPRFAEFFAVIANSVVAIEAELAATSTPSPAAVATVASLQDARVLVVDDHHGARATICALLADEGAVVEEAAGLTDARALLTDGRTYQLVVLDRALGDRDGLELVPTVRERQPRAKIVVVSGGGANEAVSGVDATLGKELPFEEFLARVRAVLGAR